MIDTTLDPVVGSDTNSRITCFIDAHKTPALKPEFFPKKVTVPVFFSGLDDHFSEDQKNDFHNRKIFFLGQILFLQKDFVQSDQLSGQETAELQDSHGIFQKHLREYSHMRNYFHDVSIGEIMDLTLVSEVGRKHKLDPIVGRTQFKDRGYRNILAADPIFYEYHLIHFLIWCERNYKKLLG